MRNLQSKIHNTKKRQGNVRTLISSSRAGFAVLFAALIGSLVLTIGLAIFNITFREFILSSQVRESQVAFVSADTGLECAFYWDFQHPPVNLSVFGGLITGNLSENLVGHWKFDESTGLLALDAAGSNDGNLTGGMLGDEWIAGHVGSGALDFGGGDEEVKVTDFPEINFGADQDFAVSFWMRRGGVPTADMTMIDKRGSNGFQFRFTVGGRTFMRIDGATVVDTTVLFNEATLYDGTWRHVVFGRRLDNHFVYIEGAPDNSTIGVASEDLTDGVDLRIGGNSAPSSSFDGDIDDVRIYDKWLPDGDIKDLFEQKEVEFKPPIDRDSSSPVEPICLGDPINVASSGWDTDASIDPGRDWEIVPNGPPITEYKTSFDLQLAGDQCTTVSVVKRDDGTAVFESRGYNTCNPNDPRRVERALRATY